VEHQLEVDQGGVGGADLVDEREEAGVSVGGPGLGDDRVPGQEERELAV
jgi:hypothetical protein